VRPLLRSVIYSERAERDIAQLRRDGLRRLDEALRAVEFAIAQAPEMGQVTDHADIWAWPTTGEAWQADPIVVYYSIQDRTVTIEAVQRARTEEVR
jgi:hypothetical protein